MFRVALTEDENNSDLTFDYFTNGTNSAHDQTTDPGKSITLATDDGKSLALAIERVIYTRLVLVVCIFGLTGNFLNLVVLSRKSLTYSMERMEKSAHYGMMGLAISDMLICAAILPNVFLINGSFVNDVYDFWLFYRVYGQAIINTFILSSTWLTVTMATSRFVAICYPLKARQFIGKTFAVTSLVVVFVTSCLFNVPRYFRDEVRSHASPNRTVVYFPFRGPLQQHPTVELIYQWVYFLFGILIPLAILIFCNAHLILALRRSTKMRTETSSSRKKNNNKNNANRITLTLVVIVVMFIVLFVPAEVLNFFANMATRETTYLFNLTVAIFNLFQAINFALNFILYCAINTHFRMAFYNLATCANFRSGNPRLGKASALSTTNRGQFSTIDHHAKTLIRETNITDILR